MKKCPRCKAIKQDNEFYKFKRKENVFLQSFCKKCTGEVTAKWKLRRFGTVNSRKTIYGDRIRENERKKNRERRAKNPNKKNKESYAYQRKYPERWKAQRAVYRATKNGKIERSPCVICDAQRVEGHHFDYQKPLEVVWFCTLHHKRLHQFIKTEKLISLNKKIYAI